MKYYALDIARKILSRVDVEHGDTISNLKLQKLLYFVQGFHLAYFGKELFGEELVSWNYGPVVPEVYDVYKKYKNRDIDTAGVVDDVELHPEEGSLFDKVYLEYSRYSAVALMQMTHEEGPWKQHNIGEVIPKDEIREYFLSLRLPDFSLNNDNGSVFDEDYMRQLIGLSEVSWRGVTDADVWVKSLRGV